jgi:peptidoglycan/LPS O-acetylase OafA/YrhL
MELPKRIPQLDVLRGLAVLLVMLYHGVDVAPHLPLKFLFGSGYVGVDLFFVLSGFLITGILVRTRDSPGYFLNFYTRRALRIWPLYYALLLFTFVVLPIARPQLSAEIFAKAHPWQAYPLFLQNLLVTGQSFDSVRVTWSLAIEEQFYLVWPLIVFLAPRRMLKPIAGGALAVSIILRWAVQYGLIPPLILYTNTLTRLDGLALGALLALWIPMAEQTTVKRVGIAGFVALTPIAFAMGWRDAGHWIFFAVVAACFAALLCVALNWESLSRLYVLRYTGKISYCLYLVHVPVFTVAALPAIRRFRLFRPSAWGDAAVFAAAVLACYALAAASWILFESKFLQWKDRFSYASAGQIKNSAVAANDEPWPVPASPQKR